MLASTPFTNAHRSRRFLEFAVQQTLAGARDSVKESVIALEVFDRTGDFDGRVDAIVRVEASKLRMRLSEYYHGEGAAAPVVIEIPKGTYVPTFTSRAAEVVQTPDAQPEKVSSRRPRNITFIAAAIVLLIVAGAGAWGLSRSRVAARPSAGGIASIAVLPFLNLSSEPNNEYFSDGLADQLTDALTQVDGLRVVSRTSAFAFRHKALEATEIGAKLRVDAILEGSVQKAATKVRITLQLIQTRDGFHLWSQTFDRELTNIFAVQDEISHAVTHALHFSLSEETSRRLSRRYTRDSEAFDLYLRGRHALDTFRPEAHVQAAALFQQALDRDPKFALAWAYLAVAESQDIFYGIAPPKDIRERIKTAADRALQIDDTLAEAHAILATVESRFDWNWTGAEQRLLRAIKLNPKSADAHLVYSQSVLLPLRRFDETMAECRVATELDPFYAQTAHCAPWALMMQGKAEQAIGELQELQSRMGGGAFSYGIIFALMHAGRDAEAIAMIERTKPDPAVLVNRNLPMLGSLGGAVGRMGRTREALEIERLLLSARRTRYVPPGALCMVYVGMGRLAEARGAAAQMIEEHDPNAYYLALDPMFAPLRSDPQFAALLRKTLGLPF